MSSGKAPDIADRAPAAPQHDAEEVGELLVHMGEEFVAEDTKGGFPPVAERAHPEVFGDLDDVLVDEVRVARPAGLSRPADEGRVDGPMGAMAGSRQRSIPLDYGSPWHVLRHQAPQLVLVRGLRPRRWGRVSDTDPDHVLDIVEPPFT